MMKMKMKKMMMMKTMSNEKKLNLYQSVNLSPTMYTNSLNDEDSYSEIFGFIPDNKKNGLYYLIL